MRAYRILAVAFVCVALAVCAAPGAAVAETTGLAPPQSLELQAALSSSEVTVAEAKENLAIQHQASRVDLIGQLEEELGESYASIWFDDDAG